MKLRNEEGKPNWARIVVTAAVPFVIMWAAYVTFQAYEVGSNKEAIKVVAQGLRKDINENKSEIDQNNSVLHRRISQEREVSQENYNKLQSVLLKTWDHVLERKDPKCSEEKSTQTHSKDTQSFVLVQPCPPDPDWCRHPSVRRILIPQPAN